ncbi:hypothetical protein MYX78_00225 [Acidobacteria bacterium AH-259-G07]|nr:hypothetical protein [Acidobacteria bacterium AH-259-G07]
MLAEILGSRILRFFASNRDYDDWQDTAGEWIFAAIVVSVLGAGLILGYKWLQKRLASVIKKQTWSRNETLVLVFVGLFPVFILVLIVWYSSRDFVNVIGVGGLIKGTVLSWILYLFFTTLGHLGPWRRELF